MDELFGEISINLANFIRMVSLNNGRRPAKTRVEERRVNVSRDSSNLSDRGMIMSGGRIGERVDGVALEPGRRAVGLDGRGHLIRISLVTWQAVAFLGSTVVAAACLLGECPCIEKTVPRATLVDQAGAIRSVAFSPDGKLLATVGGDGSLVLRDPASRRGYSLRPAGSDPVRCLAFGPDGKTLATGSRTAAVALYDLDTVGSRALDDEAAATAGAAGLAFAPDGATLAVGVSGDRRGSSRSGTSSRDGWWFVLAGHADFVASLAFAPDGATLASTSGDRSVRLWDVSTGRERLAIRGQASTFVALSFSPDGRLLALADPVSPVIRLWDVATGIERDALNGPAGAIVALAISPDGATLAAAGRQGLVNCWDLATSKIRPMRLRHAGAYSLAFAPDGHTLASAGVDGTVHLWDWPTLEGDGPRLSVRPRSRSIWNKGVVRRKCPLGLFIFRSLDSAIGDPSWVRIPTRPPVKEDRLPVDLGPRR